MAREKRGGHKPTASLLKKGRTPKKKKGDAEPKETTSIRERMKHHSHGTASQKQSKTADLGTPKRKEVGLVPKVGECLAFTGCRGGDSNLLHLA